MSLFATSGVLYVDHVALTTFALERTLADYLELPNARLLKGPGENPTQRVRYAFVELAPGLTIEILAPMENSPIAKHVARGGGAYHLCFAVADIQNAVAAATGSGARLVSEPQADPAFDGRPVAFLFHELHGIFEFVEVAPNEVDKEYEGIDPSMIEHALRFGQLGGPPKRDSESCSNLEARLLRVFQESFPSMDPQTLSEAAYSKDGEWDSLAHLQLMGEVEIEFGISIPSNDVGNLTTFAKLLAFVESANGNAQ